MSDIRALNLLGGGGIEFIEPALVGTYSSNGVKAVNMTDGIYYVTSYYGYISYINEKSGSIYKSYTRTGITAQTTFMENSISESSCYIILYKGSCISINQSSSSVQRIRKADFQVDSIESITIAGASSGREISIYKIAELG